MMRHLIIVIVGVTFVINPLNAQQRFDHVRVTGIVVDSDDRKEMPYVNISIKNSAHGTSSDNNGYFSLFIAPGDTLLFSSIGYHQAAFIMPYDVKGTEYSLLQLMVKETRLLKEIVVFPWPTMDNFKEAFFDIEPKRNMDDLIFEVQRSMQKTVNDQRQNEYYYEQMRYNHLYELNKEVPPNNFLNPMRWSNFVRDIRKGTFKKKK